MDLKLDKIHEFLSLMLNIISEICLFLVKDESSMLSQGESSMYFESFHNLGNA